jgi:hypothetical protein
MELLLPTTGTVLFQLHALCIVALILKRYVRPFLAFIASKGYQDSIFTFSHFYSIILVIEPAPTVLPPSRMENFMPTSKATG